MFQPDEMSDFVQRGTFDKLAGSSSGIEIREPIIGRAVKHNVRLRQSVVAKKRRESQPQTAADIIQSAVDHFAALRPVNHVGVVIRIYASSRTDQPGVFKFQNGP